MRKLKLFALCVAVTITSFQSQAQTINTIAGTGVPGFSGDGGPSTAAQVNKAHGLDVDAAGNIYIADNLNSRIRKISPSGVITTIAGTGVASFSGDGGPATAAAINQPFDIKVDAAGNLYISDLHNYRVRKVNTAGIISTIAGTGAASFSGDGGQATAATFGAPCGLAMDAAGNLYVGDGNNHRIRKINMTTGIISTYAGTGVGTYGGDGGAATAAQLWYPNFLYMDAADNLYISDNQNQRVRKVTPAGIITTFAGSGISGFAGDGGPATAARLAYPAGMTQDAAGNFYLADNVNHRIRKISPTGTITTFGGTGTAGYGGDGGPIIAATFNTVTDVAFDAYGRILVADQFNSRIRGSLVVANTPPVFSENVALTLSMCGGSVKMLDTILRVTDPNFGQTLVWSVVQSPFHGTLGGFSATASSTGGITFAPGTTYTAATGYTGSDSFKIKVFDGFASDTLTVLVNIAPAPVTPFISGTPALCILSTTTLTASVAGGAWSSSAPGIASVSSTGVVTAISGGVVNITYAISASCGTALDVFAMTIDSAPVSAILSGIPTLCVGGTTTITPSVTGGTWASSNPGVATVSGTGVISGVAIGTTVISYQLFNACGSETALMTVSVDPFPFAAPIVGVDSVCPGKKTTLSDPTAGGVWVSVDPTISTVASTGIVSGMATGSTTILYIVSNGCGSDTAFKTVVVRDHKECYLAVGDIDQNAAGVIIFPNPNNGYFIIAINTAINESAHVTIANVVGAKVYESDMQTNKEKHVDMRLVPGVYILSASAGTEQYFRKIVVE